MIAPLYDGAHSDIELLAMLADPNAAIVPGGGAPPAQPAPGAPPPPKTPRVDDGHEIVRNVWRDRIGGRDNAPFEKIWRRSLHDGVIGHPAFAKSSIGGDIDEPILRELRMKACIVDRFVELQ